MLILSEMEVLSKSTKPREVAITERQNKVSPKPEQIMLKKIPHYLLTWVSFSDAYDVTYGCENLRGDFSRLLL